MLQNQGACIIMVSPDCNHNQRFAGTPSQLVARNASELFCSFRTSRGKRMLFFKPMACTNNKLPGHARNTDVQNQTALADIITN